MVALNSYTHDRSLTTVDAGELSDEQFDALVTSIDPRASFIPAIIVLTVCLAVLMLG